MPGTHNLTNLLDSLRQVLGTIGRRELRPYGPDQRCPKYLSLRRTEGNENHIILIGSLRRLSFGCQHPNDAEWYVFDSNDGADRLLARIEEILRHGLADECDTCRTVQVCLGEGPATGERPIADGQIAR